MKKFLAGVTIFIFCSGAYAFETPELNVVPIKLDNSISSDIQIRPKTDFVESVIIPLAEPEETQIESITNKELKSAQPDSDKTNTNIHSIDDENVDTPEDSLIEEEKEIYTTDDFKSSENDITLDIPLKEKNIQIKQTSQEFSPDKANEYEQKTFNVIPYNNNTGTIYRF